MWAVHASLMRGISWAISGKETEGIETIIQGLDTTKSIGSEQSRAQNLSYLAEAQGKAGRAEQALATLEEALDHVEKSGERLSEAEIYRVKAGLLLLSGDSDGRAEECYHRSLEVAKQQSAKSWELRTAISLAQLWQKQGKKAEARELLAGIYGWFTEGFGTPDLIDAKALLVELE